MKNFKYFLSGTALLICAYLLFCFYENRVDIINSTQNIKGGFIGVFVIVWIIVGFTWLINNDKIK